MSVYDMNSLVDAEKVSDEVFNTPRASNCMIPMGITSENVAEKFKIDRKTQDLFAVESHKKAAEAQKNGWFKDEIAYNQNRINEILQTIRVISEICICKGLPGGDPCWMSKMIAAYI